MSKGGYSEIPQHGWGEKCIISGRNDGPKHFRPGWQTLPDGSEPPAPPPPPQRTMRYCFVTTVKPDKLELYKAHHDNIWPEVVKGRKC